MTVQTRRRVAALFEVLGVYLAGAFLNDQLGNLLVQLALGLACESILAVNYAHNER